MCLNYNNIFILISLKNIFNNGTCKMFENIQITFTHTLTLFRFFFYFYKVNFAVNQKNFLQL